MEPAPRDAVIAVRSRAGGPLLRQATRCRACHEMCWQPRTCGILDGSLNTRKECWQRKGLVPGKYVFPYGFLDWHSLLGKVEINSVNLKLTQ